MLSPRSYEAPTSLWELVRDHSAASEHHELKQLIGADLIDQTVELRREIDLLLELALDLQDEGGPTEASRPQAAPARLPEPPQMRERLAQEIVFFLESIREQARRQTGRDEGRRPPPDLRKFEVNQDVVDYAYESSSSRPSTGTSRLSLGEIRVTPCSSRSESRRTARSGTGGGGGGLEDVAEMRDQLTYMRCDEVRKKLRLHLQEEIDQLKQDLQQLQESLESSGPAAPSHESPSSSPQPPTPLMTSREPSLAELRTERHKLERALLSACTDQPALRRHPLTNPSCHGNGQRQLGRHSNKAAGEIIPRLEPLPPSTSLNCVVVVGSARPSSAQRLRSMVQQSRQPQQQLLHN